jgi:hypothetical protein
MICRAGRNGDKSTADIFHCTFQTKGFGYSNSADCRIYAQDSCLRWLIQVAVDGEDLAEGCRRRETACSFCSANSFPFEPLPSIEHDDEQKLLSSLDDQENLVDDLSRLSFLDGAFDFEAGESSKRWIPIFII